MPRRCAPAAGAWRRGQAHGSAALPELACTTHGRRALPRIPRRIARAWRLHAGRRTTTRGQCMPTGHAAPQRIARGVPVRSYAVQASAAGTIRSWCRENARVAGAVPTHDLSRSVTPGPLTPETAPLMPAPRWRRVAEALYPDVTAMSDDAWHGVAQGTQAAWQAMPVDRQRSLRRFVRALPWLAVPMTRAPFHGAATDVQRRALLALSRSPVAAVRRGILGLRTLLHAGLFADDVAEGSSPAPIDRRPRLSLVP